MVSTKFCKSYFHVLDSVFCLDMVDIYGISLVDVRNSHEDSGI